MLLTRTFAQRRITLVALVGALGLGIFLAMPQGQALAASLLVFFRGQVIQPVPTTYANLQNAEKTLQELEHLGKLQGSVPSKLNSVSSLSAASTMAGFTPAQPSSLPSGYNTAPSGFKALAPTTVTLTFDSVTANAYFNSIGSSQTLPTLYNGEQLVVNFPGVTVLEYSGAGGSVYVGQAGQLLVNISGNASADQLRSYLLTLPGLSSSTVSALKNISNWQYTIPLGIPTDRAGWSSTSVGGTYAGQGVILNDNTGIASAVLWERGPTTSSTAAGVGSATSFGVGGKGLTASQVQSIASGLK